METEKVTEGERERERWGGRDRKRKREDDAVCVAGKIN